MFFFALKGSKLLFLFVITATGVLSCRGRKQSLVLSFSADYILRSDYKRCSENSEIVKGLTCSRLLLSLLNQFWICAGL